MEITLKLHEWLATLAVLAGVCYFLARYFYTIKTERKDNRIEELTSILDSYEETISSERQRSGKYQEDFRRIEADLKQCRESFQNQTVNFQSFRDEKDEEIRQIREGGTENEMALESRLETLGQPVRGVTIRTWDWEDLFKVIVVSEIPIPIQVNGTIGFEDVNSPVATFEELIKREGGPGRIYPFRAGQDKNRDEILLWCHEKSVELGYSRE